MQLGLFVTLFLFLFFSLLFSVISSLGLNDLSLENVYFWACHKKDTIHFMIPDTVLNINNIFLTFLKEMFSKRKIDADIPEFSFLKY